MKHKKTIYYLSGILFVALILSILFYRNLFGINISSNKKNQVILIPTGATYNQVMDTLESKLTIKSRKAFDWFARKKKYPSSVKPGRYIIDHSFTYNSLINLLRSGKQTPVDITFNNVRNLDQLAGRIGGQIEADSLKIISFLDDDSNIEGDGFNKENIISVFIPNTYRFYWNTSARGLYARMLKEYRSFWNDQRLSKAKEKGLTLTEVSILASIIDEESSKQDEKPRIAGVYLNRLKRGIPLQADPTILFALNDNSVTRILKKQLTIDSPYNTYVHSGLPPGPIGCSSIESIDAVLNAEKHEWLYFAAKADFSGYHNFSRTLAEHNRYALLYQKELDKRKIFK